MAGFSSGDSSFNIKISKSLTSKLSTRIQLRFSIDLHIREKELINSCIKFFNLCVDMRKLANVNKYVYVKSNSVSLQITNFEVISNIIIPFFKQFPIKGKKSLDFIDFEKVATMVNNKQHLTQQGLNQILIIKSRMNQ